MRNTTKIKQIMARRQAVIVPGAANALFARVIEDLQFEAIYVSGAGIANMKLGAPDIGLTSLNDISETVAAISDAADLPLIVDADTGFGNALNVYRTIRQLERAGASAIQLEDQEFPKRCGHFTGKSIIPTADMVQKIRAAVDARQDGDLQIIARTDAIAVEGIDRALERAQAYVDAGADATFVEAPTTVEDMARVGAELAVPQIANIVVGGMTPDLGRAKLTEIGFSISIYANASLQAALKSARDVLCVLRDEESLQSVLGQLATFEDRQLAVAKDFWDAQEARYS